MSRLPQSQDLMLPLAVLLSAIPPTAAHQTRRKRSWRVISVVIFTKDKKIKASLHRHLLMMCSLIAVPDAVAAQANALRRTFRSKFEGCATHVIKKNGVSGIRHTPSPQLLKSRRKKNRGLSSIPEFCVTSMVSPCWTALACQYR